MKMKLRKSEKKRKKSHPHNWKKKKNEKLEGSIQEAWYWPNKKIEENGEMEGRKLTIKKIEENLSILKYKNSLNYKGPLNSQEDEKIHI